MRRKSNCFLWIMCMSLCILSWNVDKRQVFAKESVYRVSATGTYKHPVTGKIEDPGNNEGIGQGMVKKIVSSKALWETGFNGQNYVTVRLGMMDQITKVRFWQQKKGGSSWKKVSSQIMQENVKGEYRNDFRMAIQNKSDIVKVKFYVNAMGRDVIFFISFGKKYAGNGDFVVTEKGNSGKKKTTSNTTKKKATANGQKKATSATPKPTQTPTQENTKKEKTTDTTTAASAEELISQADGLVLSEDSLLQEDGTEEKNTEQEEDKDATEEKSTTAKESKESTKEKEVLPALSWVLVLQCILIITVPSLLVGGSMITLLSFLKKK